MLTVGTDALAAAVYSCLCSASDNDDFLPNCRGSHFQTLCSVRYVGSPGMVADACSRALSDRSHTLATR